MAEGHEHLLGQADDNFHQPLSDDWWETETAWFAFYLPQRKIGAWLYNYIRPNIGLSGGGVLLYDDTAWFHMETPYYSSYSAMKLPEQRDLRDFTFPSGVSVKALEPLRRYQLGFDDPGRLHLDLEWEAIQAPWVETLVDGTPRHLDQFGHVTGSAVLDGEVLEVDCYAMRDRSWQHRRREQWKRGGNSGYTCAAADAETSVFALGAKDLTGGFVVLNGKRAGIRSGLRRVERNPSSQQIERVIVTAVDTYGRELEAIGTTVSRMAMPIPGVHGVCWTYMLDTDINGHHAYGEDQDFWPVAGWSRFRRGLQGERG